MKAKGWKVKLTRAGKELSPLPFSLHPVMERLLKKPRTIEEFHGVDNMCELFKKKVPKTFRDLFAIKYKDRADEIIAILNEMIDGCTEAKDVVKPIRAAMDAGIIDRPSWPIFIAEFPEAKCGKSSLERRTNPDDDYYRIKYKGTYEDLVEYFANL